MEKIINTHEIIKHLNNYKHILIPNETDSIDQLTAKANEVISVNKLIKKVLNTNKNTIFNPTFIDAFALKEALEKYGNPIEGVEIWPIWNDETMNWNELIKTPPKPDSFEMRIKYSRYSMDGNGFHVGYENVTFKLKLYDRNQFGLYNYPTALSHLVALPSVDQLEIIETDCPSEELPEVISHDSKCATLNREESEEKWNPIDDPFPDDCDCGCNDGWEGYNPPDNDFFYQDMDHIFYLLLNYQFYLIPEATFNPDTRTWELGERSYTVGTPIEDNYWWLT